MNMASISSLVVTSTLLTGAVLSGQAFAQTQLEVSPPSFSTGMRAWMQQREGDVIPYHLLDVYYQELDKNSSRSEIIFPIEVHNASRNDGYYFAQYVVFDDGTGGYIGIQPRPDGKAFVPFSFFGKNVKALTPDRCSDGADGGDGISCHRIIKIKFGKKYYMRIKQVSTPSPGMVAWAGYVSDAPGRKGIKIAAWEIPESAGKISYPIGFYEYYLPVRSCQSLPPADVTFYQPYTVEGHKLELNYYERTKTNGGGGLNPCNPDVSGPDGEARLDIMQEGAELRIRSAETVSQGSAPGKPQGTRPHKYDPRLAQ